MTALTLSRCGEILPDFTLPDIDGSSVTLESCRGQTNLVVVFTGGKMDGSPAAVLLEELVVRTEELKFEAAQVFVVVTARPDPVSRRDRWPFPMLEDEGARIHRHMGATNAMGRPAPAALVTDRFREIFAAYLPGHSPELPGAKEILEWLVFINIQCPECGVPEWAP